MCVYVCKLCVCVCRSVNVCMCDLGGGDVYIVYLTSLMLVCQEDLGLESLLAQYVTPEVIDNAHCPGCAKKRSASKDSSRPAIKRTLTIGKVSSGCLLYTSPSPRDISGSRMPSSA